MKKIVLPLVLLSTLLILAVQAQSAQVSDRMGIGLVFGLDSNRDSNSDVGLSLKFNNFPVIGLKWAFKDNGYLTGTCDYWMLNKPLSENIVFWYFGVGGYARISADPGLGARFPVGLQLWPISKLELFLEAAPILDFLPSLQLNIQGAFGVRYHI